MSNVVTEDDRDGAHYVCVVENEELRAIVEGDDQKITPRRVTCECITTTTTNTYTH